MVRGPGCVHRARTVAARTGARMGHVAGIDGTGGANERSTRRSLAGARRVDQARVSGGRYSAVGSVFE